jgi:hypothetical protein
MSVLQVSPDSSVFGSRGGVTGVVPSYQCGKRRPVIRETRQGRRPDRFEWFRPTRVRARARSPRDPRLPAATPWLRRAGYVSGDIYRRHYPPSRTMSGRIAVACSKPLQNTQSGPIVGTFYST